MAYAKVQESTDVLGTGTPSVITISLSPTAGNALVVLLTQINSSVRTYSISDNIAGTTGWNEAVINNPGRIALIKYKVNVPSGVTTITLTASGGTNTVNACAQEWSGFGTVITVDASDTLLEVASLTTHTCSTSGVTSGNALVAFCAGALGGTGGECNPGSGYTEIPASLVNNQALKQYQIFNAGCTSEVGTWTNTTTARVGTSCIALLSGNAGAAAGKPWTHYAQQMSA